MSAGIRRCSTPCSSTHQVAPGGRAITFRPCGVTSYHPKDVEHRYCALCGRVIPQRVREGAR